MGAFARQSSRVIALATLVFSACVLGPQPEIPGESNSSTPDRSGGTTAGGGRGGEGASNVGTGGSGAPHHGADAAGLATTGSHPAADVRADAGADGATDAAQVADAQATDGASGTSEPADGATEAEPAETGARDLADAGRRDGRAGDIVRDANAPSGDRDLPGPAEGGRRERSAQP